MRCRQVEGGAGCHLQHKLGAAMGEGGGGGGDAGDGSAAHVCYGDAAVAGSWGGEVKERVA